MRFTGQVRLPEIDHPGVPATILVEDDQVEVFLEGESLGRWSLNDVHASRLVSAAFSIALAGEEITFIADEPVDFAYKGVDHMAEVWARYRSMTVPRRVVAVGRSRRGTLPSRIEELRQAMLQNLETAGKRAPRLVPVEAVVEPPAPVQVSVTDRLAGIGTVISTDDLPDDVPMVEDEGAPPAPPRTVPPTQRVPTAPPPPRLRPGAGLFALRKDRGVDPVTPGPDLPEPPEPPEPPRTEAPPLERPPLFAEPPLQDAPLLRDEPLPIPEPLVRDVSPPPAGRDEPLAVPPPLAVPEPVEAPEAAQPLAPESGPAELPTSPEVPELVKELLGTSSDEGGEDGARDLVVDLGHYEAGRAAEAVEPDPGAGDAESVERSGLLGSVRSAFARNKVIHEHEFVEAPGGIGIVRQICAECGYISIGVSD